MCLDSECRSDGVGRRDFVAEGAAALLALGAVGAAALAQDRKQPPTRVLDDPTIRHGKMKFRGGDQEIAGYLARPKAEGKYPAVLVIAGNLISEEYIPNTCAALAVAGFVGLAPNIFHVVPADATPAEMNKVLAKRTDDDYLKDIRAGADYLKTHE